MNFTGGGASAKSAPARFLGNLFGTLSSKFAYSDRRPFAAFTMAEVLITLGVIGIVAAMTIPNLVKKWEERAIIGKYKKMYSTLANAYNMAIVEYGDPANWVLADREEFLKRLEPYPVSYTHLTLPTTSRV